MDSLDIVEAVMLIEEIFGSEIPDRDAENFGSLFNVSPPKESQLHDLTLAQVNFGQGVKLAESGASKVKSSRKI